MTPWNLEVTELLVRTAHGDHQAGLLEPCLRSIADRQIYAAYHYHEYKKLIHENIDSKIAGRHLLELILDPNEINRGDFYATQKHIAANVIACAQNLHCVADTLAHAAYYASAINLSPTKLVERAINLSAVSKALIQIPRLVRQVILLVLHS